MKLFNFKDYNQIKYNPLLAYTIKTANQVVN